MGVRGKIIVYFILTTTTLIFWLAVNGKPVLFWKGISGLKFPCFIIILHNMASHSI